MINNDKNYYNKKAKLTNYAISVYKGGHSIGNCHIVVAYYACYVYMSRVGIHMFEISKHLILFHGINVQFKVINYVEQYKKPI